jgi:hypothetical protein
MYSVKCKQTLTMKTINKFNNIAYYINEELRNMNVENRMKMITLVFNKLKIIFKVNKYY